MFTATDRPSVCVASIMRIKAIGILNEGDITRTFQPFLIQHSQVPTHSHSDTLTLEYIWSQVEPGVAIFCACAVTYKPLFTNIEFSRIFSALSRSSDGSSRSKEPIAPDNNANDIKLRWPMEPAFPRRDNSRHNALDIESAKGGVCVVNVGSESYELFDPIVQATYDRSRDLSVHPASRQSETADLR